MDVTSAAGELIDHITDVSNGLTVEERIMVLCTVCGDELRPFGPAWAHAE